MVKFISNKKVNEAIDHEINAYLDQLMIKQMSNAPDTELLCLNERINALKLFKQHINEK